MREIVTTVRQAMSLLSRDLRRRWWLQAPWALFSALLEMIATAAMLLLIRLITDPAGVERMASMEILRRWLGFPPGPGFNAAFGVLVGVLFLVKNSLRVAENYAQERCAAATAVWISSGLLERYLRAPYSLHLRRNSSEMLSNVSGAADQVSWVVLESATALISESLVALGILTVLVDQLPPLARGAAALTAGVTILLLWITQHRHIRWGRLLHSAAIQRLQNLRQSLAAAKEAKILGRERYFVTRFARIRAALGDIEVVQHTTEIIPRLVVETTFVVALAALIVIAWLRSNAGGDLMLTLGIFAYGGLRLLPSLHLVVYRFNRVGSGAAAVKIVSRDWQELAPFVSASEEAIAPMKVTATISLEAVSFSYEESHSGPDEAALSDVDLAIRVGESIGIVGPTGSGKTTLVDLILGILEPTSGAVRVDGRDIRLSLRSWHQQIGYVPQAVYLIDDTIRRNIALGLEDAEIDEERVLESARAAQLDGFLRELADGLNTVVGERGVKLSGGERQRIAVARALYRRPSVLVFDEATSALDNVTEQALTATIQALPGKTTKIFIAHRLSTVQSCDRLVFLRKGRISGVGTYAELQRNPEFLALSLAGDVESRSLPALQEPL
ncbi:MAG: ABC transporter ATP-binding protein/permease [Acidobacteriia bacterium]|nr:ABC transporter ATP-binding protein/permease [Terriglobia bacterium]